MTSTRDAKPIIVVGAGLVGLNLAQGLKKRGFAFKIYDRDSSLEERPAGWGITMHWALPALAACLPHDLYAKLPSIQVDPAEGAKEHDSYKFLDLSTGEDKFGIPSSLHYRLNRKKFRKLLSTGLDVNWGKKLTQFERHDDGVVVHFADGTSVHGSMLLGVDGKHSRVKKVLMGEDVAQLNCLPVVFMGLTLRLAPEKMQPFRDIHPVLWQGSHPSSGYYIFFSMLSTPKSNGSSGSLDEYYETQFNMSWLVQQNGELPKVPAEQIARVKAAAAEDSGFFPRLKEAILQIPDDNAVMELKLEDWPTQKWPCEAGTAWLVGDAAHTMTMYRGEAANHGIYDAVRLVYELWLWRNGSKTLERALEDYQAEILLRTHEAVLKSRAACIEAHDIETLGSESAIFQVSGFNADAIEARPVPEFCNKTPASSEVITVV